MKETTKELLQRIIQAIGTIGITPTDKAGETPLNTALNHLLEIGKETQAHLDGNKGYFEITSLSREDLSEIIPNTEEREAIGDSDMIHLASKMADDYCNQMYWESLRLIAEYVIPHGKYLFGRNGREFKVANWMGGGIDLLISIEPSDDAENDKNNLGVCYIETTNLGENHHASAQLTNNPISGNFEAEIENDDEDFPFVQEDGEGDGGIMTDEQCNDLIEEYFYKTINQ